MPPSSRALSCLPNPLSMRVLALAGLIAFAAADVARAEPPCWAPAHGYRAKHGDAGCDKHYRKKHKRGQHRKGGHGSGYDGVDHGHGSHSGSSTGGSAPAAWWARRSAAT